MRETESRLATIIEAIPGFITIDRKWRCTEVSGHAARAIGKTRQEIIGRSLWDVFPYAKADLRAQCARAWRTQKPVSYEYHSSDGRWFELFLYPFSQGLSLQGHDITDRKRAEQALRESERLLRTVLENTPQGYAIYDADRRFQYINSIVLKLANAKLEDVIGKRDEELWPEAITRSYLPHIQRAYETGLPQEFELDTTAVSGDEVTMLVNAIPLKDASGKIQQTLVATYDLTERKRNERVLIEADRRKDEFLAVLSHELRNPLTPLRYSLYVLDRAAPGSEQAQHAKAIIQRQVDQLARIIDDLLEVSRISRGKIKLQRVPFDLGAVVRRTADDYAGLFVSHGIDLAIDIADRRLVMNGDATRIAQVVGNLLQNAAKYTPQGGNVFLSLAVDEARHFAIIRVRDTGVGISAEMLPRLFHRFEQAPQSLDRSSGGLGLGLSLVKALVEMHGGEVKGSSQGIGRGAEFVVGLPLQPSEKRRAAPSGSSDPPRRRVLVIEDNVDAARALADVLKMEGHEVEVAYDGRQGVQAARRYKPEAVFCDIGMPGMDGYQVAKALRRDKELRGIYLVALTGYAFAGDRARARSSGFDEHLGKPSTVEKLRAILSHLQARKRKTLARPRSR